MLFQHCWVAAIAEERCQYWWESSNEPRSEEAASRHINTLQQQAKFEQSFSQIHKNLGSFKTYIYSTNKWKIF